MHVLLYSACCALLALAWLSFIFFKESKPFVDSYGNHASVLGLLVSVVGFALTLWTVLETLRVNAKAQEELRKQVNAVR
jgi:hypothetical protein